MNEEKRFGSHFAITGAKTQIRGRQKRFFLNFGFIKKNILFVTKRSSFSVLISCFVIQTITIRIILTLCNICSTLKKCQERIVIQCLEKRIAVYSPHTAWDAVEVNHIK